MQSPTEATIADLLQLPDHGKAELVNGEVDLLNAAVVRVYRASAPDYPTVYRRGEVAEAEPAVPGWSMAVDDLFNNLTES